MKTLQTNDLITARNEDTDETINGRITEIDGELIYLMVEDKELVVDVDQISENHGQAVSA